MSNLVLNKQEYKEILSILDTTIGYIELSNEEYDEIIEQEEKVWKPPYNSSKEELLLMLEK